MPISVLDSKITSVTVFREGAEVIRKSRFQTEDGHLKLTELPLNLEDETVRVSIPETSGGKLIATQVTVGLHVTGVEQETDLSHELAKLLLTRQQEQAKGSVLQDTLRALSGLEPAPRHTGKDGSPPPPQDISLQLALLDFRAAQQSALQAELRKVERQLQILQDKIQDLQELERRRARDVRPEELRKFVLIQLSGNAEPEELELRLSYQVPAARWTPSYTARFSKDLKKVELSMKGLVAQRTEEDWSSVSVHLSTATRFDHHEVPELKSLRIGRRQVEHRPTWCPPPVGTDTLFHDLDESQKSWSQTVALDVLKPEPLRRQEEVLGAWGCEDSDDGLAEGDALLQESVLCAAPVPPPPMEAPVSVRAGGGGPPTGMLRQSSSPQKKRKAGSASRQRSEAPPTIPTLDLRYRQFRHLRMTGWDGPKRGQLVCKASLETYCEHLDISLHIMSQALDQSGVRTGQLSEDSLPPGHPPVTSLDGFDVLYPCQGFSDIPADGQYKTLPVLQLQLDSDLKYLAVPRESTDVFRTAELTNTGHLGLLGGPVDILVEGEFLQSTRLEHVNPSGKFTLGLGVTPSVKITRQTHYKETSSGLMGAKTSLPHTVEMMAQNTLSEAIKLEIQERLPEADPEHKSDIKVELNEVQPQWESFRPETDPDFKSAFRWVLDLGPGEKIKQKFSYTIHIPAKFEISGGNRRERLNS